MNKTKQLTVAALALAVIGIVSTPASAQVTVAAGANDMILGFEEAGINTNLEIDLGSLGNFTNTANLNLSSDLSVADLNAIFGTGPTGWTTSVNWSVAAENTGNNQFDATSISQPKEVSSSQQALPYNQIGSLYVELNGATSTANSNDSVAVGNNTTPASGIGDSYTSLISDGGKGNFGAASTLKLFAEQTGAGTDTLYEFDPGTTKNAVDIGTFTLGSNGSLDFVGSAYVAPEPSTYALLFAGLGALVLMRRMRRNSTIG